MEFELLINERWVTNVCGKVTLKGGKKKDKKKKRNILSCLTLLFVDILYQKKNKKMDVIEFQFEHI